MCIDTGMASFSLLNRSDMVRGAVQLWYTSDGGKEQQAEPDKASVPLGLGPYSNEHTLVPRGTERDSPEGQSVRTR